MIHKKQLESVEYSNYSGGMITNNARCTCEIKSRITMAKGIFNNLKTIFTGNLNLNLEKKLIRHYIEVIAMYGAEPWILRKEDQNPWNGLKSGVEEGWRRLVGPTIKK
jgi:hypothetical protein